MNFEVRKELIPILLLKYLGTKIHLPICKCKKKLFCQAHLRKEKSAFSFEKRLAGTIPIFVLGHFGLNDVMYKQTYLQKLPALLYRIHQISRFRLLYKQTYLYFDNISLVYNWQMVGYSSPCVCSNSNIDMEAAYIERGVGAVRDVELWTTWIKNT